MSRREEFKARMKELKQYKDTTGKGYWEWKQSLPDNLKYTDESQYDLKGAYEAGLQPEFNQEDGLYHLGSRDPKTGRILKRNTHPTYWKALAEDAKIGYDAYWIGNDTYTSRKGDTPIKAFALGGDNDPEEEQENDVFAQFIKQNPMQPGSTPPAVLSEQGRVENLPYEQNEYQKQFAKAWYTQRAKYDKYESQLGGDKLDAVLQNVDKSTYQTLPQYAETALNEYARLNNIDRAPNPIEINMKTEQLQKNAALGFTMPEAHVWHVKPKTVKTKRYDTRGLGWHEGIGHVVGDNSEQILQSAPRISVINKNGDKEYDKYANNLNEQHASTWEFRGANAEMLDDYGKRYIDPNRQLNSYDIRKMIEKGATLPVQWRNSNITDAQIAEFLNSFAYNDQEVIDNTNNDYSLQFDKVLTAKNGGQIPAYKEGGDTEDDIMTTIVTNTVRKALEKGDVTLVKKMLRRGNRDSKEFYYPDNGSITPLLNLYDTPLLGDALSLLDAIKYSVKGDWDNASTSYLDAVTPFALFKRSKLNWKQWGAKQKYIPEYTAIEYQAKKNGTWLKNTDGSDFTGDPREWVVKQSKRFKEAFGDKYKEGYTGMRNPYDPNSTLDTYLASRDRAYTYTQNKREVKKKGDSGVAKLVVPETNTYTVDALGNDWLHLTDKSVNPYNFTNTNQIVSSIQTPTISFKNIRDDGPFGVRDVAEDQFVIKANTPRKSVLYNNGDFDLSNSDIFKTTIAPYIGYKLYNKANREDTQSYATGGETDQPDIYTDERTDHPIVVRQNLDRNINVANYIDRINHIDPNIGEYNPFYTASDDTYGTVSIPEVTVTAPWTKQGRNNADARRGMHYVQQGLEDAAKIAAPIVAGAALPAMASTGALGAITDLASIIVDPLDPLNYLPYSKVLRDFDYSVKGGTDMFTKFLYQDALMNPKKMLNEKFPIAKPKKVQITDDIQSIIDNTVFPRLERNRKMQGNLKEGFNYGDLYEYNEEVFKKADDSTEGFYIPDSDIIVRKSNSPYSRQKVFSHELRHRIDSKYPYNDYEKNITDKAFDGFQNAKPDKYKKDYDMSKEIPTTIVDARNIILSKYNKQFYNLPLEWQDEMLRRAPKNLIEKAIEDSNGYGRRFIRYLDDNDLLNDQRIENFREALIVGGLSSPIIINNNSN